MATFDGVNLIITLDATGGVGTVDILTDLYEEWKIWQRTPGPGGSSNKGYPQAFIPSGGDDIDPALGLISGQYTQIRNDLGWRIRPAEEDATINFVGNLIAADASLAILTPTVGAFTVLINGLQPITQVVSGGSGGGATAAEIADAVHDEALSGHLTPGTAGHALALGKYAGVVWLDPNGSSGTTVGVNGTHDNPVDNVSDAVTLAESTGLHKVFCVGGFLFNTFTAGATDVEFVGVGEQGYFNLNGQAITNCKFVNCFVQGATTGTGLILTGCEVFAVTGTAIFEKCRMTGTHTIDTTTTNRYDECYGLRYTAFPVVFDCGNGANRRISTRRWVGDLTLQNYNNDLSEFDMAGGVLTLDSTVTGGTIRITGQCQLVDNSVGATVIDNRTVVVSAADIADAVLDESRAGHVAPGSVGEAISMILGLVGGYRVVKVLSRDVNNDATSIRTRIYSTKADADTDDGATGLLFSFTSPVSFIGEHLMDEMTTS